MKTLVVLAFTTLSSAALADTEMLFRYPTASPGADCSGTLVEYKAQGGYANGRHAEMILACMTDYEKAAWVIQAKVACGYESGSVCPSRRRKNPFDEFAKVSQSNGKTVVNYGLAKYAFGDKCRSVKQKITTPAMKNAAAGFKTEVRRWLCDEVLIHNGEWDRTKPLGQANIKLPSRYNYVHIQTVGPKFESTMTKPVRDPTSLDLEMDTIFAPGFAPAPQFLTELGVYKGFGAGKE